MLKIQKQRIQHKPSKGLWGDCHRTAYACILGKEAEEVPHFAEGGDEHFKARENAWLEREGLQCVQIVFPGETPLRDVLESLEALNPGVPYILGIKSNMGGGHSVVAVGGEIVCDPSLSEEPKTYDPLEGFWWITYVMRKLHA